MPSPRKKRLRLDEQRAAQVRAGWDHPDTRQVQDPDKLLAIAILAHVEGDLRNLPPSLSNVIEATAKAEAALKSMSAALNLARVELHNARSAHAYLQNAAPRHLPIDLICDYLGLSLDRAIKTLLEPLSTDLADFLQRKPDSKCPLCHTTLP